MSHRNGLPSLLEGFKISEAFDLNPIIYCKCGCRGDLFENNGRSYIRQFIMGHNGKGKYNSMYGTPSPRRGKKLAYIHRKNLSINKLKFYREGNDNPMKGRKHSKETRLKMSDAWYNSDKSYGFSDTKPERFIQSILSVNGIEYELQKKLQGKPDIFINPNICIFVDGCFWHGCKQCCTKKQLDHNITKSKRKRDDKNNIYLRNNGYKVIRIWEHEINDDLNECLTKIKEYLH